MQHRVISIAFQIFTFTLTTTPISLCEIDTTRCLYCAIDLSHHSMVHGLPTADTDANYQKQRI
jgi:hypothetical protein